MNREQSAVNSFEGQIIVVTGGGSGIGAACATLLAERGAQVVVADVNQDAAQTVANGIGGHAFTVDVRSEEAVTDLARTIETDIGPVAGIVTSAGIVQAPLRPEEIDMALYDNIYAVNLRGTFLCLRAFAKAMISRKQGSLVTISSITATRSVPLHAYAPTKAAVRNLTMGLAGEWGNAGLRVNTIEPGYTRTPAIQDQIDRGLRDVSLMKQNSTLGRMVEAEEIAKAAAFLLSNEASAISGIALPVDAGYYCAGSWAPYGGVREH